MDSSASTHNHRRSAVARGPHSDPALSSCTLSRATHILIPSHVTSRSTHRDDIQAVIAVDIRQGHARGGHPVVEFLALPASSEGTGRVIGIEACSGTAVSGYDLIAAVAVEVAASKSMAVAVRGIY